VSKLFEVFPYAEVYARIIYKNMLKYGILKRRLIPNEKAKTVEKVDISKLNDLIDKMGVKEGDMLIVHSSMSGIKGFGLSAEEIIKYFQNKIGKNGILLMPTYPEYNSLGKTDSFDEVDNILYEYNVQETKGWTGYITEVFRKQDGTVRSCYPNNSLSAQGSNIERIFERELETDLAFDKKSVWNFCRENHAKVLFLGIHAHHSISEIHIAEDLMDDKWPVKGWYTTKRYRIVNGDKEIYKDCRVRKNFWTKYMVEYNGCARLRKSGHLIEGMLGNICVSYIPDLFEFEKFVERQAEKGDLIYFKIPRKYRKPR
jgi:aminoglycoside 3-N-acetyltransferase